MVRFAIVCLVSAVFVGAVVGNIGSRTPAAQTASEPVRAYKQDALASEKAQPLAIQTLQDSVELKREPDGHFYADVEINNMPIRMVVDTGATGIALSRDDARKAGLAVSAGMFEVVGQGASGDVRGEIASLDSVQLGHETATKMPAIILDSGEQSLLGQSFLQKFETVEIKGDRMILR